MAVEDRPATGSDSLGDKPLTAKRNSDCVDLPRHLEAEVETLVIDSGWRDGSLEIARRAGVRVIEISPADFGHGRTRNFAAEQARVSGHMIEMSDYRRQVEQLMQPELQM